MIYIKIKSQLKTVNSRYKSLLAVIKTIAKTMNFY